MNRVALLFFAACPLPLGADIGSGPKTGTAIPALPVTVVVGDEAGKAVDLARSRKDRPTVTVFVQPEHWSRPVGRFLSRLDDAISRLDDAAIETVWLSEKTEAHAEYLPNAQKSLQLTATRWSLFSVKDGLLPKDWAINPDAHLTVVVIHQNRVVQTFALVSVNETDVKPVLEAARKAWKPQ